MTQGACDQGAEGHALSQPICAVRPPSVELLYRPPRLPAVDSSGGASQWFSQLCSSRRTIPSSRGRTRSEWVAVCGAARRLLRAAEQLKDVVVTNSCTALRWAASRVRKIWRYHGLIMMLRQSRASLSARSWADRKQPTPDPSSARRPLDRNDLMFMVCSIGIRRLGQAISRHGRDIGYRGRGAR